MISRMNIERVSSISRGGTRVIKIAEKPTWKEAHEKPDREAPWELADWTNHIEAKLRTHGKASRPCGQMVMPTMAYITS